MKRETVKLKFFQMEKTELTGRESCPTQPGRVAQNQLHYHVVDIHIQKGGLSTQICSMVSAKNQISIKLFKYPKPGQIGQARHMT
jgi:hypothetical protein